jgi:hypothetical protein
MDDQSWAVIDQWMINSIKAICVKARCERPAAHRPLIGGGHTCVPAPTTTVTLRTYKPHHNTDGKRCRVRGFSNSA